MILWANWFLINHLVDTLCGVKEGAFSSLLLSSLELSDTKVHEPYIRALLVGGRARGRVKSQFNHTPINFILWHEIVEIKLMILWMTWLCRNDLTNALSHTKVDALADVSESQLPHKIVNLLFTDSLLYHTLPNFVGELTFQNRFINTLCQMNLYQGLKLVNRVRQEEYHGSPEKDAMPSPIS